MKQLFSIWRVLVVTLTVIVVAVGIVWCMGLFPQFVSYAPANSIMVIAPYRHAGTWVFDDERVGLSREPFVAGIPEMIDEMVEHIPDADKGFRLTFSAIPFPSHTHKLIWRRGDEIGNWYYSEKFDKEGWLCPGLLKYYREAPREIYVKADPK